MKKSCSEKLRTGLLYVVGFMLLGCGYVWYENRGYKENAAKREAYFLSMHLVLLEAKEGDALETVINASSVKGFDDSLVRLYADPRDELGSSVSDFLELKWVRGGDLKYWELHENNRYKVGVFERDRLILSEKYGLRWESGRNFFSERARGSD